MRNPAGEQYNNKARREEIFFEFWNFPTVNGTKTTAHRSTFRDKNTRDIERRETHVE